MSSTSESKPFLDNTYEDIDVEVKVLYHHQQSRWNLLNSSPRKVWWLFMSLVLICILTSLFWSSVLQPKIDLHHPRTYDRFSDYLDSLEGNVGLKNDDRWPFYARSQGYISFRIAFFLELEYLVNLIRAFLNLTSLRTAFLGIKAILSYFFVANFN